MSDTIRRTFAVVSEVSVCERTLQIVKARGSSAHEPLTALRSFGVIVNSNQRTARRADCSARGGPLELKARTLESETGRPPLRVESSRTTSDMC